MTKNVGSADRAARGILGLGLVIAAVVGGPWWLGLAGAVLLGTAAMAFCPLYVPLGLKTLGRATREQRMFGLLTTLQVGAGSQLVPVACPIALIPFDQSPGARLGLIGGADPLAASYRAMLDTATASDFCRWRQ